MMFKTPGCLFRGRPCLGGHLHSFTSFSVKTSRWGESFEHQNPSELHAKPIKILLLWGGIRFWASRSWAWSPCLRIKIYKHLVIRYDGNPAFISHWAVQFGYPSSSKYHYLGGPYQTTKVYWSGADIRWFTIFTHQKPIFTHKQPSSPAKKFPSHVDWFTAGGYRRTCNVFPRPMSSAKMQPKPFRALFTSQW